MRETSQHHHAADKEVKRKKQFKRMSKILAKAWEWDEAFQESSSNADNIEVIRCLAELGAKLDRKAYKLGRHGWEAFAQDLGGVFNWHIQRYESMCVYVFILCIICIVKCNLQRCC